MSIDRMRQYRHDKPTAPVLIVTHRTTREAVDAAIVGMAATGVLASDPVSIRIEAI